MGVGMCGGAAVIVAEADMAGVEVRVFALRYGLHVGRRTLCSSRYMQQRRRILVGATFDSEGGGERSS